MINKIKRFYSENKVWMQLLKYVLISIALATVAILIDTRYIPILHKIPSIFLASIDLSKTILSTLAGALLTITTFTFSTIMVVLTMYSSDFSPRVVDNFLTDKISMKVLGIFVGGFFYSIITLFFMKDSFSKHLVVSATIGVVYAIFSILYFVVFIYKVSSSIQATKLIKSIYDEAYDEIEEALEYKEEQMDIPENKDEIYMYHYKVKSKEFGYLQITNINLIFAILRPYESRLVIHPHIGDYIGMNEDIATLYYNDASLDEDIIESILRHITLGDERLSFNDYRFSVQKIVDIALRALSPGINDPNTAIHCINILGVLVGKLSTIEHKYTVITKENFEGIVVYEDFDFADELYLTFHQIAHYGKDDISVIKTLLETLNKICNVAYHENLEPIKNFSGYVYEISKDNFTHPFDLNLIKKYS